MKVSARSRYALRILLDIALHATPERPRTMREISRQQGISEKFISRLVVPLREHGMIHSVRGKQGGFKLARSPQDINLLEIIETMDGAVSIVDCAASGGGCPRLPGCAVRMVWVDVNDTVRLSLAGITLERVLAKVGDGAMVPIAPDYEI